jgi:hypothetical protein
MSFYLAYKLNEPGKVRMTRQSRITGKVNTREIPATPEQFEAWQRGMLVQDAFPDASPEDREFIISGITPEEWTETFGKEA